MPGYDGPSGHTAVRIEPLDEMCREYNRKYLMTIGYKLNNLFTSDWDEDNFQELNFYDLYEVLHQMKNGQYSVASLHEGINYEIPKSDFESVFQTFFQVDGQVLQQYTTYHADTETYQYRTRGMFDFAPTPYSPYPEVISYEENQDGTIKLTVNAVWTEGNLENAFCHEVIIRPLELVQLGEEERKRAILENQMVQMQREIEEIQDIYTDMRGLRHDMKSHLESIAAVIRKISCKDKEELGNYIEKMETTVSRLDFAYRTGNPITDVIIHQKKQEAEKQDISFEADFTYPDKQQIDVYDIGIVLNNALENAIEASSKVRGKKSISLRSYMKGNLFFIEVENYFWGEIIFDRETGLPVSSKADKQLHGLGMENIQRCARKYMGGIDVTIHNTGSRKKFNLTIMMYEKYFTP